MRDIIDPLSPYWISSACRVALAYGDLSGLEGLGYQIQG